MDDVIGASDLPVPALCTLQVTLNFNRDILKLSAELFKPHAVFNHWTSFATVLQGDRQIENFAPKQPQRGLQGVRDFCNGAPIFLGDTNSSAKSAAPQHDSIDAETPAPGTKAPTASTNAAAEFPHFRFINSVTFASNTRICTNAWR